MSKHNCLRPLMLNMHQWCVQIRRLISETGADRRNVNRHGKAFCHVGKLDEEIVVVCSSAKKYCSSLLVLLSRTAQRWPGRHI